MSEERSSRRGFIAAIVALGGAIVAGLLAVPGLGTVLDPILRPRRGAGEFMPAGEASVLRDDRPVALPIIGDLVDAWTRAPARQLGTVWVQKKESGELLAMTAECPHLGCKIGFDEDGDRFFCPCHKSAFGRDGSVEGGPSPRPMDELEARVRDGHVEIRFKRFRIGSEDKTEIG